jgi:hypothetical protein
MPSSSGLTPRNAAMFISGYLLSATTERNPEPSYAENDGAGVGGRSYE